MKLSYKRTIFVGFAFFLICAFWQAYDNVIPKILTDKFGMSQTLSGVIMALDNILALFMLPLFGAISDRTHAKRGKRTPYILVGTIIAAIVLVGLSFADNAQLKNISAVSAIDDKAALQTIYESTADATLKTPDGKSFVLQDTFTEEEFTSICSAISHKGMEVYAEPDGGEYALSDRFSDAEGIVINKHANGEAFTNPHYTAYVVPARQAYAWQATSANTTPLIVFVCLLLVVLLAMAIFRSPAVALMPDVTVKPLRSKANAVINLMGSAGGILILGLGMVFATSAVKNALMSYTLFFATVSGIMLLALLVFLWQVKEPKLVEQMHEDSRKYGIADEQEPQKGEKRKLSKAERRSLFFLLASIILWFFGYNAVTSKYSVYASNVLNKDYNLTMMIAQAAAIAAYLPVGIISSKIGRKKTIFAGIIMLTAAFGVAMFLREGSPTMLMNCMFALAGIGWATINVNSFPMVVEMCRDGDVGKYTGFYYTASMAAQTLTPMLSGFFLDKLGMRTLFPYATIFVALAFVTMIFVRHGDNKPAAKRGLEALDVDD